MPSEKKLSAAMARRIVEKVISHHFNKKKPKRIVRQRGGLSNFVFLVTHMEGDFIVRISPDPATVHAFIKEQWAVAKVQKMGVPGPQILEVGNKVVPFPYMITQKVNGRVATLDPNRLKILFELGTYAARINSIRTNGFGDTFDWTNNQLSRNETWLDFLDKEWKLEERLQTLRKHRMLRPAQLKKLRSVLLSLTKVSIKPTLNHGDLRLKNVIVNKESKIIAIVDWENCSSNISPCWELSLALHDLAIDEKQKFLEGYGLSSSKLSEIALCIKAVNLLNYAPHVARAAEKKDTARLDQFRARLGGALDLYSLK